MLSKLDVEQNASNSHICEQSLIFYLKLGILLVGSNIPLIALLYRTPGSPSKAKKGLLGFFLLAATEVIPRY